MAGRGPAAATSHTRKSNDRKNTTLVADGKLRGGSLPKNVLPAGQEWHPVTVKWWNHWRRSPQGTRMLTQPDWDYLLDTALIHHMFWMTGRFDLGGELRLRVAKFGATPEDRQRLQVEVAQANPSSVQVEDDDVKPGNVTEISDRWDRVAGGD